MRQIYRREPIKIHEEVKDYTLNNESMALSIAKLEKGRTLTLNSREYEAMLVILSGTGHIRCGELEALNIGERANVFSGKPVCVYIPKETEYTITGVGYNVLEIAICKVKAENKYAPFVILPKDVIEKECGQFDWKRTVHEIMINKEDKIVDRIIVGETYGCPGEWASYPYGSGQEKVSEEAVYYFKITPSTDEGLQVMQPETENPVLKNRYKVHNDSVIEVEKAYKPVASLNEYNVYYLWIKRKI